MLVLLFVALWFILRGDLFCVLSCVLPCVIWFLCFSVLLALRLPRLGKTANLSAFRTFVRLFGQPSYLKLCSPKHFDYDTWRKGRLSEVFMHNPGEHEKIPINSSKKKNISRRT